MDGLVSERWRPPVICGATLPARPRGPLDCKICLKPLPLIRHPNMSVCEGACQVENRKRVQARGNARREKNRRKTSERAKRDFPSGV